MTFMRGPRIRRLPVVLAVAGLAAAGIAGCSSGSPSSTSSTSSTSSAGTTAGQGPELSTITVETLKGDGAAPLWIAQQDGYFKQQGLTVKIVYAQGASSELTDLQAHTAPFVEGNYVTLLQAMNKDPSAGLRIVADNVRPSANTDDLMVAGNSKITSVKQLKGKSVAFPSAGLDSGQISLDQQLKGYGLSPHSYTDVPMSFSSMAAELKNGTIAAAFAIQPYITEMETKDGDHVLLDLLGGPNVTLPLEGWMSNTYFTQHDPRTVAAFQRAIVKAQAVAAANPKLVRSLMIKNIPTLSPKIADVMALRTYSSTITATQLDRVVVGMQQLGALPKNFSYADLIVPLPSSGA
jgi:NitT/TauT family transport system substrate-binding protein